MRNALSLGDWIRNINPRKSVSGAAKFLGMSRRHLQYYWLGQREFPMSRPKVLALARYIGADARTVLKRFAPAECPGCVAKDARIAALEMENQQLRQQLGRVQTIVNLEPTCTTQAKVEITATSKKGRRR